jgi:RNA polymerase sigma factor (sigma-70 family)
MELAPAVRMGRDARVKEERNRGVSGTAQSASASDDHEIARLLHQPEASGLGAEFVVRKYETICLRAAVRWANDVDVARDIVNGVLADFIERETDPLQASFDEGRSIEAYLITMVRNRVRDHFTRRLREEAHIASGVSPEIILSSISSPEMLALDRLIVTEQRAIVQQCLAKLPSDELRVLMLRFGDDPLGKFQAIADELGLAVSTIDYRIKKALRHLKEILEECGVRGVFHAGHE